MNNNLEKWELIQNELNILIQKIFNEYDIKELTNLEKRKIIFDYLTDTISYDYKQLERIKNKTKQPSQKIFINKYLEFYKVLKSKKGVCNTISQVYKMLLEFVNIYAICVICDDGRKVKHQLNLVYDDNSDCYSFDDVTSAIINKEKKEEFFNYDIEKANKLGQGKKNIINDEKWVVLPTSYVYSYLGRRNVNLDKYDIEIKLPENIRTVKNKTKKI